MITDYKKQKEETTENSLFIIEGFFKSYKKVLNLYKNNIDSVESCKELHDLVGVFFKIKESIDKNPNLITKELKRYPLVEALVIDSILKEFDSDRVIDGAKVSVIIKDNQERIEKEYTKVQSKKEIYSF